MAFLLWLTTGIAYHARGIKYKGRKFSKFPFSNYKDLLDTNYAEKNTVFVAFRGTVNIPNAILDIDVKQINYPACDGCKVHEGFYKGYQSAAITVRKYIQ